LPRYIASTPVPILRIPPVLGAAVVVGAVDVAGLEVEVAGWVVDEVGDAFDEQAPRKANASRHVTIIR
jgi:hypothetical protein